MVMGENTGVRLNQMYHQYVKSDFLNQTNFYFAQI